MDAADFQAVTGFSLQYGRDGSVYGIRSEAGEEIETGVPGVSTMRTSVVVSLSQIAGLLCVLASVVFAFEKNVEQWRIAVSLTFLFALIVRGYYDSRNN